MKQLIYCIVVLIAPLSGSAQQPLNIQEQRMVTICAASSVEDDKSLGGFAPSTNYPKKNADGLPFRSRGLAMQVLLSDKSMFDDGTAAHELYILNRSDSTIFLNAQDSRLYVFAQALVNGKWQNIEFMPRSWCGNSYHRVGIKPNEYWTFKVPKYSGKIHTKLRYQLAYGASAFPGLEDDRQIIYSNEFDGSINLGQLSKPANQ